MNAGDVLDFESYSSNTVKLENSANLNSAIIFNHVSMLNANPCRIYSRRNSSYTYHDIFQGGNFCHQAVLYHISLFSCRNLLFNTDLFPFADLDLNYQILSLGLSIARINSNFVFYDATGLSSRHVLRYGLLKLSYLIKG